MGPPNVPPNSFCEYPRGETGVPERMAAAPAEVCWPCATCAFNWLARVGHVAVVQKPVKGLRASNTWLRANSQADPWKLFVPLLVTMLTTEPRTLPYCVSLLCDWTLNSWMVSAMGGMLQPP